jgi:hypothetical protein
MEPKQLHDGGTNMFKYRIAVVPALLVLVSVLFAANLIFAGSALSQTAPRPPKVTSYMIQARNDFRNGAAFTAAPGYKIDSIIPCAGVSGPYGQGAYLCMIEKQDH